uniref:Uncharacterized protein n=1 Tax=Steinernema glaseri TaxID=37863 RepID=A0A1I7ZMS7_9BILA
MTSPRGQFSTNLPNGSWPALFEAEVFPMISEEAQPSSPRSYFVPCVPHVLCRTLSGVAKINDKWLDLLEDGA